MVLCAYGLKDEWSFASPSDLAHVLRCPCERTSSIQCRGAVAKNLTRYRRRPDKWEPLEGHHGIVVGPLGDLRHKSGHDGGASLLVNDVTYFPFSMDLCPRVGLPIGFGLPALCVHGPSAPPARQADLSHLQLFKDLLELFEILQDQLLHGGLRARGVCPAEHVEASLDGPVLAECCQEGRHGELVRGGLRD